MCRMRYFLLLFLSCVTIENANGMSEKQLQAAVKLIKNACIPKSKASTVDIDKMHQGDWNIDHTAMCYLYCALNMYKLIGKDNRFDYDSGMAQIKIVPEVFKESTLTCMDECRDSVVTLNDKCVAAYEIAKCIYFCNPDKYYLP